MLIIWRGWGIIPIFYAAAAVVLAGMLGAGGSSSSAFPLWAGVFILLAAVGTWFTGVAMNRTNPERKVDLWARERRAQLDELANTGMFSLGPGQPQPTSVEEAQHMSDALLASEVSTLTQAGRNRHTLFFIPMQFFAFVFVVIGLLVLATGLFGAS
ncbi:hypothetical protein G7067_02070 [Leucobacter insecticola]|uniref:Uncharacterized protein n=1 Tax=Leucobacter insecticola TaxID=2714934 RepID=A0A6G8FGH2_9MICO|nr:hypothetical protein [Leucobacter insecticola]QIM15468.1 hypothetical protein G7067_02070 [Leucobacter insecticola]